MHSRAAGQPERQDRYLPGSYDNLFAGNTASGNGNITVVGHNRFANVTNRNFRYTPSAA